MLTVFWDIQGVICTDYTTGNCNSQYYIAQMKIARKKRRKPANEDLWLLQDNAPIHNSFSSFDEISKAGFKLLSHPPYSPDLAPSDFYLFTHLKKYLRGHHFNRY